MINEQVLDVLHCALLRYKNTGGVDNRTEHAIAFDRALGLVDALRAGDVIASMWWIDDVFSIMYKDGEEDWDSEAGWEPTSEEVSIARDTLRLVEKSHNAEIGINWEVIREALVVVQEKRMTETTDHGA